MSRMLAWIAGAAVAVMVWCVPAQAVVNGLEPSLSDRRFDCVGLFFSGAWGDCGGSVSGSCVLIAPNVVLVARHSLNVAAGGALPDPATTPFRVRFRRKSNGLGENQAMVGGNPCHGNYQERRVVQLVDAPGGQTDQALAYLDTPVNMIRPAGVEVNNPPTRVMNIVLVGWGYGGSCFSTGDSWTLRYSRGKTPDNTALTDWLVFSPCTMTSVAPCLLCPQIGGPYVMANLHDSGAAVFLEVPSTDPADPTPELRLISTVSTLTTGRRPTAWNNAGGQPRLVQAPPRSSIKKSDFNADGAADMSDIFCYLNAYFTGAPICDMSMDSAVSIDDLMLFLNAWMGNV